MDKELASKYQRRGKIGTLKLVGAQEISAADALKESAMSALQDAEAETVRIDAAKATTVDTASWQVIAALCNGLRSQNRRWEMVPDSCELTARASAIGLQLAGA